MKNPAESIEIYRGHVYFRESTLFDVLPDFIPVVENGLHQTQLKKLKDKLGWNRRLSRTDFNSLRKIATRYKEDLDKITSVRELAKELKAFDARVKLLSEIDNKNLRTEFKTRKRPVEPSVTNE